MAAVDKRNRKGDRHTSPRIALHLPAELLEVIDSEAARHGRTRTAEVLRAVTTDYARRKLWPGKGA